MCMFMTCLKLPIIYSNYIPNIYELAYSPYVYELVYSPYVHVNVLSYIYI